jgi:hypothetical protein
VCVRNTGSQSITISNLPSRVPVLNPPIPPVPSERDFDFDVLSWLLLCTTKEVTERQFTDIQRLACVGRFFFLFSNLTNASRSTFICLRLIKEVTERQFTEILGYLLFFGHSAGCLGLSTFTQSLSSPKPILPLKTHFRTFT